MKIINENVGEGLLCKTYLHHAYKMAQQSPDPSTQVGAVIVNPTLGPLSHGFNKPPDRINMTDDMLNSKDKNYYIEHAERNAILDGLHAKYDLEGCTMYSTWAACPDCARAIIACGIVKVVSHKEMYDRYMGSMKKLVDIGIKMMEDAGIEMVIWSGIISEHKRIKIRTSGRVWTP